MRITNSTLLRHYNRNLNRLQNAKTASEHKILTGRKFDRASESPLSAAKALNIRKQLSHTAQYKENLDVADKFYTEAETSLLGVSERLSLIRETIIAAVNTTKDPSTDLQIYAQQLETKAQELCSIFNTDTAERVIFGGESNNPEPFTIAKDANGVPSTVLYHGVPLNAMSDPKGFPYSNDVYMDIGIGMVVNQETQKIDGQTGLLISFNGADVTGCGSDGGVADIDLSSIVSGRKYSLDVYADGVRKTIEFEGGATPADSAAAISTALDKAYKYESVKPTIDEATGIISLEGKVVCAINTLDPDDKFGDVAISNDGGYTDKQKIDLTALSEGEEYTMNITVGGVTKKVTFTAGADAEASAEAINDAFADMFAGGTIPHIETDGKITAEGEKVRAQSSAEGPVMDIEMVKGYSNNYIQLTLDAAKALRNGDIDYANGCIDRIVNASENLLVEIADLGCKEEFIEFNTDRFTTRETNLKDRQKTLEATDLEEEITLMKTYEALYNAALQMSSSVIPNSIFNYIS